MSSYQSPPNRSDVLLSRPQDPELLKAHETARKTLHVFWKALSDKNPQFYSFALRASLPIGNGSMEHIWVTDVTRNDRRISGVLKNKPAYLDDLQLGDEIEFQENQVTDWQYVEQGVSHGNFVTKVMLKSMNPEEANSLREELGWEKDNG